MNAEGHVAKWWLETTRRLLHSKDDSWHIRLQRDFENIRIVEDENPLLFLGRVDKAADELAMLGCGKSVEEVSRHVVTNLSPLYVIQRKFIRSRPSISRS